MSKTFKDARESVTNVLTISFDVNGLSLRTDTYMQSAGIIIAPSDAPALALAILEAAGYAPSSEKHGASEAFFVNAMSNLRSGIEALAREAAAEADRVALQQEALALCNTYRKSYGASHITSFGEYSINEDDWLAVARRAREINKEAGQ